MSDGGNGVTSSAIALRVKVVAMFDRTHNPFDETHWVSCLRENLTSSSDGEGLETGLRSTVNGHEGGNPGYSQGGNPTGYRASPSPDNCCLDF